MSGPSRRSVLTGALGTLALAVAPKIHARAADPQDTLAALARQFGMIGVSAGVRTNGKDAALCSGLASVPFKAPVTPETLFHIGSNAKHVTAIAMLRLIDGGALSLSSPIGDILEGLPEQWRDRTLESLMNHTSGLPDYAAFEWDRDYDHAQFLAMFAKPAPLFEQGASWSYSNTGYVLLGWIIEKLTGRTYRAVVEQDLFAPLNMPHVRIDDATAIIPNRAEPYEVRDPADPRHAIRMSSALSGWPDGGILMSARDVPVWDRALTSGGMLSEPARARMLQQTRLTTGRTVPYGLGLWNDTLRGKPYSWHGGRVPGFVSAYLRCPDDAISVLVMTNAAFRGSAPQRIVAQAIAEAYVPGSTVRSLRAIRDAHPALTRMTRTLLARGDQAPDRDILAPEIRVLMGQDDGRSALPLFSASPERFDPVEDMPGKNQLYRRYRMTFADRIEHVLVGYAPDGRIFYALNH